MALTKKGTLAFGIGAGGLTDPAVSGISNTTSAEASSEYVVNVTAKDTAGEVAAHVFGSAKHTLRVEGFGTAATVPTLGTAITVAGKTGATMRASVTGSNEDFVKISVEGEGHAGVSGY